MPLIGVYQLKPFYYGVLLGMGLSSLSASQSHIFWTNGGKQMAEFTCKLKEYRALVNLTQEALAEKVNVRRETIIRLEAGKYNPSLKLAMDISKAVNAPIEDIFIFDEER
jgi:DNA-binding XRE family transcriptional regulator